MKFNYISNHDLSSKTRVQSHIGLLLNAEVVLVNRLSHALYCWAPSHLWEGHCTNKSKLTDASINNDIFHNMIVNFNPLKSSVCFLIGN